MSEYDETDVKKRLEEAFGNGKIESIKSFDLHDCKILYKINGVNKLDTITSDDLRDILSNCGIIFEKCAFENVAVDNFKNLTFINCEFETFKSIKNNSDVKGNLSFENCKFNRINLDGAHYSDVFFSKCKFESSINIGGSKFYNFKFQDCEVLGSLKADKCVFKCSADFKNTKFDETPNASKTIDLSETVFEDNVYFDACIFNSFVAFHATTFKRLASFYKARFNVTPNFSSCDFRGVLNLNNTIWFNEENPFDFDVIKDNSQKAYANNFLENTINFRDSFRGIKHVLLEKGNFIDASNYRKAELYCKEMQLEHEMNGDENARQGFNKNLGVDIKVGLITMWLLLVICAFLAIANLKYKWIEKKYTDCFIFVPIAYGIIYLLYKSSKLKLPNLTKWFECISLYLYRNTSDHHTNLNKIFHFTLLMIATYSGSLFAINFFILNYDFYIIIIILTLNLFLLAFLYLSLKNISKISASVIMFLISIFMLVSMFLIPHVAFAVLLYFTMLVFSYWLFIKKHNFIVIVIKIATYIILFATILKSPEFINPAINVFNKENIENKNLLVKINQLDYKILSNLARLSFKDYDVSDSATFIENNVINQRDIIIANKGTLENIFGFLFASNSKERLMQILNSLEDTQKLSEILKDNTKRRAALDLISMANKQYKQILYDMEIRDEIRKSSGAVDEKTIKREINYIIYDLKENDKILKQIRSIIDNQEIYLDIYKAIKLDRISGETYRSTYTLYVIVMLLCLYSLTKTARKNSIVL